MYSMYMVEYQTVRDEIRIWVQLCTEHVDDAAKG